VERLLKETPTHSLDSAHSNVRSANMSKCLPATGERCTFLRHLKGAGKEELGAWLSFKSFSTRPVFALMKTTFEIGSKFAVGFVVINGFFCRRRPQHLRTS
jgi:hypothetical protein